MRLWLKGCALACLLASAKAPAQVSWSTIPTTDDANTLLALIKADQPTYSSLPEGSTYNYIWAQHMIAWMVAERSGLMTNSECSSRLSGLLNKVVNWQTYNGFYYDSYNASTGAPTSQNVYFQSWWQWALILTKAGYPSAATTANTILSRYNYVAAGMVTTDKKGLAADKNAGTGAVSFYFYPTGDISGELRGAFMTYTWLTGDVTPWQITSDPAFITVSGQQMLSVWHHMTFDPFYVHTCFPELGYFQKSYSNMVTGANSYRTSNGMTFYAARMEPLEAWTDAGWPNTEHRAAKAWTAWLTNASAPVMSKGYIPGYGIAQYFDNWNFYWGYGTPTAAHPNVVGTNGTTTNGAFEATFQLETLPSGVSATNPPILKKILVSAKPDAASPPSGPLDVLINYNLVGQIQPAGNLTLAGLTTVVPTSTLYMGATNTIRLQASGTGAWDIGQAPTSYRPVKWMDNAHSAADVTAARLEVYVDGQRAAKENPYAFLCRCEGAYGNFPWKLLPQYAATTFGRNLVAWVGSWNASAQYAHVIYNVTNASTNVTYTLSPWETASTWTVVDYASQSTVIPSTRSGSTIRWTQGARKTVLIK